MSSTSTTTTASATQIRARLDQRSFAAWEQLSTAVGEETPSELYARVRGEMIEAERAKVLEVRSHGQVDSEVVSQVLGLLDIEESMLDAGTEARASVRTGSLAFTSGRECDDLVEHPVVETVDDPACATCLADGTRWVSLRQCLTCGHVGCCDSSVGKHADRALPPDPPPGHAVRRARRGLALVLRAQPHRLSRPAFVSGFRRAVATSRARRRDIPRERWVDDVPPRTWRPRCRASPAAATSARVR